MNKLQNRLSNFQKRMGKEYKKLRRLISRRLNIVKPDLQMWFFNFKIRLPNIAITAPLIGALIILILAIFMFVVGFRILHPGQPMTFFTLLNDFYSNAITTLLGIAVTVLIIDGLNRIRDDRLEKIRLLRDIGCGDRGIALRAVVEITHKNLHQIGFLRHRVFENAQLAGAMLAGADLSYSLFHYADLTGVELYGAKLQRTCFWHAILHGADFRDADLTMTDFIYADLFQAHITIKQLQSAYRLHGARLPNGKIYDGRFNLSGDIQDARILKVDVKNPIAMASWYAMPYDQFMRSTDLRKDRPEITDWDNW